ncbi:hypothetical protein SK128_008412, partial [Halocaridina rubra]
FNSARGHEQERQEYLDHLRQLKWLQEPISSDSDKEEEEDTEKTPTQEVRRRSKRNFDEVRGEDDKDEDWSYGPVRKWPRTPHTQRKYPHEFSRHSFNSTSPSGSRYRTEARHQTKVSPYEAQRYYDSNYRGRVAPQYDTYYYQQGSGIGPHRPSHQWSRNVHWDSSCGSNWKPRQYQGPRHYRTPKRERETLDTPYNTTPELKDASTTPDTPKIGRLQRNPFSPDASDNAFSPINRGYRRYRK